VKRWLDRLDLALSLLLIASRIVRIATKAWPASKGAGTDNH